MMSGFRVDTDILLPAVPVAWRERVDFKRSPLRSRRRVMLVGAVVLVAGGFAAAAPASNMPVAIAPTGRPPVALAPPHHTPMPSGRRPSPAAVAAPVSVPETRETARHDAMSATVGQEGHPSEPSSPRLLHPAGPVGLLGSPDEAVAVHAPGAAGWWWNTAWALAVVVAIIIALRSLLQRIGPARGGARSVAVMEVVGRVSMGPRSAVVAVRIGHRIVVVGQAATGLSTLADLSDPNEVAAVLAAASAERSGSMSQGFASIFGKVNRDYDHKLRAVEEGGDMAEFGVDRARDEVGGLVARVRSMVGRSS